MNNEQRYVIIADSGSTKTDWAVDGRRLQTQGINPFHQDEDTIRSILRNELLPQLALPLAASSPESDATDAAHQTLAVEGAVFYGSGVRPELEAKMEGLLREIFPNASHIEAHSDLLGAARALCGGREGIACILGTGANSCLFDGERIVRNTPPLGYILGDEGSGAVLGIRFLNALYKGQLDDALRHAFEAWAGLALPDVIARVYRQPMANRWLASLSPFIHQHISQRGVQALVVDNFRDFIRRNIVPYRRPDLPLNAVGSIAYHYQPQLQEAARQEGYAIGIVVRSPLDRLTMPKAG
ncbi:MAG: ATPase [Prevotella sp.]|nr:ATPase [Prevotella sp.]